MLEGRWVVQEARRDDFKVSNLGNWLDSDLFTEGVAIRGNPECVYSGTDK